MHLRADFERMQEQSGRPPLQSGVYVGMSPRPASGPVYVSSPYRPQQVSPYALTHSSSPYQFSRPVIMSPQRILVPSPQRILVPSPDHTRKRLRHSDCCSSSSSNYSYSSSESDDEAERENVSSKRRRTDAFREKDLSVSRPPSPPKYYPEQSEEEDIDSSDSEYEDEDESVDSTSLEDLRDFIDFNPKYNQTQISRRSRETQGDDLADFLFNQKCKPRKWFRAFAWNAVGPKLSRHPTPTR